MACFKKRVLLLGVAALLWTVTAIQAQPAAAPAKAEAAAEDDTAKPRAISNNLAATLAASMPKYNPPPQPAPKEPGEAVDLREIDKPRNQIIRLPQYVVREERPPVFTEREISTTKGLNAIALQRYFSQTGLALNRFTIPLFGISKEAYAQMLYAEDERLRNMAELESAAADVNLVDPANARKLKEATRDTYQRGFDYTYRKRD